MLDALRTLSSLLHPLNRSSHVPPRWVLCTVLFFSVSASVVPARAQPEVKLLPSDGAPEAEFGRDVALSGDVALVGAPIDGENGSSRGSAYVFRRDGATWVQEAKLLAADGAPFDYFGSSVALDGDVAIVGSPLDDDLGAESGSAYVFRYDGAAWMQEAKLLASDGAPGEIFGTSVALDGDVAVIGASFSDDLGADSGSAFVFRYDGNTWAEEAQLLASDGAPFDFFGNSLALSEDLALVGAQLADNSGSVYVFGREGSAWTERQKLLPEDSVPDLSFGFSVALGTSTALIGAVGDTENGSFSGSAFLFQRDGDTWVEQQKISPSDGGPSALFGFSVALRGDAALIGAREDDENGFRSGSAYVFQREESTWAQREKLSPSDGGAGDGFGGSVALDEGTALVGALFDGDNGELSGSAYVFPSLIATSTNAHAAPPNVSIRGTYPNPATGQVRIDFEVGATAHVRLTLYDVRGRQVLSLQEGPLTEGTHTATLDTEALAPGLYLLRAETGTTVATRRLTVVR